MEDVSRESLEHLRKSNEEAIKLNESLQRLYLNADFKVVFMDELFKNFAAECVIARGALTSASESQLAAINKDIDMIGTLHSRLSTISILGTNASDIIDQIDSELDKLEGAL